MRIWLVIALVIGIFGASLFGYVVSLNNDCVTNEQSVIAQYKENQNNYDNFYKKVKETAHVSEKYAADFKSIYDTMMKGRYGENGSKAIFNWIKENNPTLDSSLYKQVQQVIESGRNDFEINQKMLIDKKRVYELVLQKFPNSLFVKFLGFPKIDMTKFDIVTSEATEQAFETKKAEALTF